MRDNQSTIMTTNMEYFGVDYHKFACPPETQDDPRYKEIGNQCFYYESTRLSQAQAQDNCKDKFRKIGAGGKNKFLIFFLNNGLVNLKHLSLLPKNS